MALKWPDKDPDEVLDYLVDWAARIPTGDAIVTSEWIVPDGIVKDSDDHTDDTATIWLSGGTIDKTYNITNRVVTDGGRTMDQTVRLKIKAR